MSLTIEKLVQQLHEKRELLNQRTTEIHQIIGAISFIESQLAELSKEVVENEKVIEEQLDSKCD